MKFKKKFLQILTSLGLLQTATEKKLTPEQWDQIAASYKEAFNADFYQDVSDDGAADMRLEQQRAMAIISQADPEDANTADVRTSLVDLASRFAQNHAKLLEENRQMRTAIETMAQTTAPDVPLDRVSAKLIVGGPGTNATHLFGINSEAFSLNQRWNRIASNPAYASLSPVDEETDGKQFRAAVMGFGKDVAKRYAFLKNSNLLDPKKLMTGMGVDLTSLGDAGLGDQYVLLRQDALIARVISLQSVYDIFPRRYGIQDRELITNAFFGEFSQAYQRGQVWKGDVSLEPEMGHVDDSMFKTLFGPMKELERLYIGYLNMEGSDPIKWSMIEWQLLNIYTALVNEQNRRRIIGIYLKPATGVAGSYLNASTGLIYSLVRYIHENKLLVHADADYATYSKTTMLDAVRAFVSDVQESLSDDMNLDNFEILLNQNHRAWWKSCIRTTFSKDIDFKGPDGMTDMVPDSTLPIRWVPNMGQNKLMILQEPGNLQCLEFVPGEMLAVKIKEDMEEVKAWSTWKEGFSAGFVGRGFATQAALLANAYKYQRIFCNKPAADLEADATTITADGTGFWFRTVENTVATNITDITGAKIGPAYIIECGNVTNASEVDKLLKFANITAKYVPTAVGDYLMVALGADEKFIELERCVAGVRTINKDVQPNIPGAR